MDYVFVYRNPETAASGGGYLKGLKIAVQPNISVEGWPTAAGSQALSKFTALEDATIIRRLRQAGAQLCGYTRMSEFGFSLENSRAGEVLQGHDADAELVLDLMGESRLAAARVGVCGFKPSYGLVSRYGLIGLIPSMECCGVLSRSLPNIRAVFQAVAGPDELDFSLSEEKAPDLTSLKIEPEATTYGVITEAQSSLTNGQKQMFLSAVDKLQEAGFIRREMSLPDFPLFSLVHQIVGSVEASSSTGRYDSVRYGQRAPGVKNWNEMYLLSRGAAFGPLLKSYLFQGAFFQYQRYEAFEDACRIRARLLTEMQRLTAQVDFMVFPAFSQASSEEPSSLSKTYTRFNATAFASVTGQPALYLPPTDAAQAGLQLAGARLGDTRLLALGEYLLNVRQGGQ
jgi:aspartyl-tRNA(Asn)/glutamyl-tRNA(Gln) amidotransferase subunit A